MAYGSTAACAALRQAEEAELERVASELEAESGTVQLLQQAMREADLLGLDLLEEEQRQREHKWQTQLEETADVVETEFAYEEIGAGEDGVEWERVPFPEEDEQSRWPRKARMAGLTAAAVMAVMGMALVLHSQSSAHATSQSPTDIKLSKAAAKVNKTWAVVEDRIDLSDSPNNPDTHELPGSGPVKGSHFSNHSAQMGEFDVDSWKCPPGNYLNHTEEDRALRNSRLASFHNLIQAHGFVTNPRESVNYKTRGYATFESSAWPKHESCLVLKDEDWSAAAGYFKYRDDSVPDSVQRLQSTNFDLQFNLNWKVASTSLPSYLACEYGHFDATNTSGPVRSGDRVVFAVRDPVTRFASAMEELLQRSVNAFCPGGECTFERDYWQGNTTLEHFAHQTSWYQYVADGYNATLLNDVVKGFVLDTACNYYTYASEHFTTQSTFITQNGGKAADTDTVVKLESIEEDLSDLAQSFGLESNNNCTLPDSNAAVEKPGGVPSEDELLSVLESDDHMMMEICRIYAQDFICFDYDVPEACASMF